MNIDPVLNLNLKPTHKHVMTVLTFRAYQDDCEAHMDLTRLMEQTGLARRTVQQTIKDLEQDELITVRQGWGRGNYNIYVINPEKVEELCDLQIKGASGARFNENGEPYKSIKHAKSASLKEKNLDIEKGAKSAKKYAENAQKGAKSASKGAADTPIKHKNIKNKTRAHKGAHKRPPRTGSNDPAAKKGKNVPAVNRRKTAGGAMPQYCDTLSAQERDIGCKCLQGSHLENMTRGGKFGHSEDGKAIISDLKPFAAQQIWQSADFFEVAERISKMMGQKVELVLHRSAPISH
jgi:hypothetical protein